MTLPEYTDSQVMRFLETLHEMKCSLNDSVNTTRPKKYMAAAIADGWPFESELGKLICEAEVAYHRAVE